MDVGSRKTRSAAATRTVPSCEVDPPARAVSRQRPAAGKVSRTRYTPCLRVARAWRVFEPVAVTDTLPRNETGRTASRTAHGLPSNAAGRFPATETWTPPAPNDANAHATGTRSPRQASLMPV